MMPFDHIIGSKIEDKQIKENIFNKYEYIEQALDMSRRTTDLADRNESSFELTSFLLPILRLSMILKTTIIRYK